MKTDSAFPIVTLGNVMVGLTKREYASIKFMQALAGRWTDSHDNHHVPTQGSTSIENLAKHSIELADELLKQLET